VTVRVSRRELTLAPDSLWLNLLALGRLHQLVCQQACPALFQTIRVKTYTASLELALFCLRRHRSGERVENVWMGCGRGDEGSVLARSKPCSRFWQS
jgi:hypothetical protein